MNNTNLKISICQMLITPGRPDKNYDYIIKHIDSAVTEAADVVIFPEMSVPGYLIGDLYEDDYFVRDIESYNQKIIDYTANKNIVVIFGSLTTSVGSNEDGRLRKHNSAIVAQNGKTIATNYKTLQPNYRFFDDGRHFFSNRQYRDSLNETSNTQKTLEDILQPFEITTANGQTKLGLVICEDMWHTDYPYNPIKILKNNGADLIVNISSSPWTWRKNQKRHRVVKELLSECQIPLIYVNNVGAQNNGKNVVIFDGNSTIYNSEGNIVATTIPYKDGISTYSLNELTPIEITDEDDIAGSYSAIISGLEAMFSTLPASMRRAVIGLSGGIDSALSASLLVKVLGPDNVIAINMPSKYNSDATKNAARQTADSLGIKYLEIPIQSVAEALATTTDVEIDSLAYENIQARSRMEILAAEAQKLSGVFIANGNKVEVALGYGTLYGDIAGFVSPIGDLVKREVYQLADYINREIYCKQAIATECFTIKPSAELKTAQTDPFDYGHIDKIGYHDQMVKAFVEWRKNPEWFLEKYIDNQLETELGLTEGTITTLFVNSKDFITDLETNWRRFTSSYFKRVQAPPIIIVSKRAFGFDLRESLLENYLTQKYFTLKNIITK